MALQLLIAAVDQKVPALFDMMRLQSDAVLVNQCGTEADEEIAYGSHTVRVLSSAERGVGASRNLALRHAGSELLLFSDEDIVYDDGYAERVEQAFSEHPEADMLLFNVMAMEGRRTYRNTSYHRIGHTNYGRYPAYSIAARTKRLQQSGVTFSLLFGGGAPYSNGEDSLFLKDCLNAGLRIYAIPVDLGHERERESTWFHGYNEKFFFDRGVLYHFLYGAMAVPLALRFLLLKRKEMCRTIPVSRAFRLMRDGIRQGKKEREQET